MRGFMKPVFKNKTIKEIVLSALFWIVILYIGFVAVLYIMQRSMMYFPSKARPDINAAEIAGMQELTVQTEDGLDITGWYKSPSGDKPVIVWFHGNAGDYSWREPGAIGWVQDGFGILLVGYRGYAGNPGKPSEDNLYKDARAYISALRNSGHDIILYGESLGTGVVAEMALSEANILALVLEAPYTSTVDVALEKYPFVPVSLLMKDRFETIKKIPSINKPLLILHGAKDTLIRPEHAQKLFDAANEPKEIIIYPDATHSDLYEYGARQDALRFFNSVIE